MKYTVGVYHEETHLNVEVIRDKLTRSIPAIFPAIMDELKVAIEEHIPAKEDGMLLFGLHYTLWLTLYTFSAHRMGVRARQAGFAAGHRESIEPSVRGAASVSVSRLFHMNSY